MLSLFVAALASGSCQNIESQSLNLYEKLKAVGQDGQRSVSGGADFVKGAKAATVYYYVRSAPAASLRCFLLLPSLSLSARRITGRPCGAHGERGKSVRRQGRDP